MGADSREVPPAELPTAEEMVARYLDAVEQGGDPDRSAYVARLDTEGRASFDQRVEWAMAALRALPQHSVEGDLVAGRYELTRLIGQGGAGRVWRAHDRELGRNVALKLMWNESDGSPVVSDKRFKKEAQLLAQLDDPRIVTLYDCGQDRDMLFLAMAEVRGIDLATIIADLNQRIRAGELARPRNGMNGCEVGRLVAAEPASDRRSLLHDDFDTTVAAIAAQAAGALHAAHARGIVHRDLKPSNVMLTAGGWPVLVDFGLGGMLGGEPGTVTGGFCGTRPYLAIEQARTRKTGSEPRSDIYQLGLVLYELITLRRAIDVVDDEAALLAAARGEFPSPRAVDPNVSAELDAICMKALEPDIRARYQVADDLRADLQQFVDRNSRE